MNIYLEIYETIKNDIVSGIYKNGEKLPSKRVTADKYDVSLITVEHSYELLLEEGFVEAKERSGYYVSFEDVQYGRTAGKENPFKAVTFLGNASLDSEAMEYGIYAKKARKVLTDFGEEILIPSDNFGCEYLREAIASYLRRNRHIDVKSDRIIVGSGAEYLYGMIVRTLGRNIIYAIESPSYKKIEKIYNAEGVSIDHLELEHNGINSEQLWNSDAGVLHISPYRSYPSGVSASASKKREYLKWSVKKQAYIVEDDFESEFSPLRKSEETLCAIDKGDRVIYVNTFTKTIGAAIRMAYMVIPAHLKEMFKEKVGFYSCTVPTYNQYIVAELISEGDFERHINRVRRKIRK